MTLNTTIHPHDGLRVEVEEYSNFTTITLRDNTTSFSFFAQLKDLEDLKALAELVKKIWPEKVEQMEEQEPVDNEIPF